MSRTIETASRVGYTKKTISCRRLRFKVGFEPYYIKKFRHKARWNSKTKILIYTFVVTLAGFMDFLITKFFSILDCRPVFRNLLRPWQYLYLIYKAGDSWFSRNRLLVLGDDKPLLQNKLFNVIFRRDAHEYINTGYPVVFLDTRAVCLPYLVSAAKDREKVLSPHIRYQARTYIYWFLVSIRGALMWMHYLAYAGTPPAKFASVLSGGIKEPEPSVWRFLLGDSGLVIVALILPVSYNLIGPFQEYGLRMI